MPRRDRRRVPYEHTSGSCVIPARETKTTEDERRGPRGSRANEVPPRTDVTVNIRHDGDAASDDAARGRTRAGRISGDFRQLLNAIPALLRAEIGLTDDVIAGRLNVPHRDARKAIAILRNQGRVDRCWTGAESYVVLPLPAAGRGASAA